MVNYNDLIWEKGNNRVLKKNNKKYDRVISNLFIYVRRWMGEEKSSCQTCNR